MIIARITGAVNGEALRWKENAKTEAFAAAAGLTMEEVEAGMT